LTYNTATGGTVIQEHILHATVLLLRSTTSGSRGIATSQINTSVKVSNKMFIYTHIIAIVLSTNRMFMSTEMHNINDPILIACFRLYSSCNYYYIKNNDDDDDNNNNTTITNNNESSGVVSKC